MKKFYFEMTEAERVFNRIKHDLDWAECTLSQGVVGEGTKKKNMDENEFKELYEEAVNGINRAYGYVYRLLCAVQEQNGESEDNTEYLADKPEASLADVNDMIGILTPLMRAQGSDEREVQKCVLSIYDQFAIPEEDRSLLKMTGVVKKYKPSIDRGVIEGDDGKLLFFTSQSIAGENTTSLNAGEIVSYIPDGGDARCIENNLHYASDKKGCNEPLTYHEVEDDLELDALKGCTLIARVREEFKLTGPGMDLAFKSGEDGVRRINLLVADDGMMYLSEWY